MDETPLYRSLSDGKIGYDLSLTALEEAARFLKPRREYKLYINPKLWTVACSVLRLIGSQVQNNPFAPYVNLISMPSLATHEWFIEGDAGETVGSKGVE